MASGELRAKGPMRRHALAVEQAGGAERKRAGADRPKSPRHRCGLPQPVEDRGLRAGIGVAAARHQERIDRQRQFGHCAARHERKTDRRRHRLGGRRHRDDVIEFLLAQRVGDAKNLQRAGDVERRHARINQHRYPRRGTFSHRRSTSFWRVHFLIRAVNMAQITMPPLQRKQR